MANSVPFDVAMLYGILFEATLYGLYLAIFSATLYVLFIPLTSPRQSRQQNVNKILVVTTFALFASITTHYCTNMARMYGAYVTHLAEPSGPLLYFAQLSSPLTLTWAACYIFEATINDGLTVYRLFVVWGNNYFVCIPPTITLLGMLVSGLGTVAAFANIPPGADIWTNAAGTWLTCSFVLGLTTNVLAVSLIGYRILIRDRKLSNMGTGSLKNVVVVIIESAALYRHDEQRHQDHQPLSLAHPLEHGLGILQHRQPDHRNRVTSTHLRVGWVRHFKPMTTSSHVNAPTTSGMYPMRVQVTTDREEYDTEASIVKSADKFGREENW
ncbi:hypothetical protein EVG20_g1279 [Dentipellis fragilis]|uniref:Uncharacterized protein n=1 Tax=Dentipellis fragilis TaxID=205917 RepID=A0A4Y9ZCM1_9AGAM|nr:hypothetical protein EVG20_g1279 [Dentipellis fragilis]